MNVFTLQSIKSRIETNFSLPSNDRWEDVFTLQSIKSRIETISGKLCEGVYMVFLLYSPLNQGLKHNVTWNHITQHYGFYSTVH